MIQIPVLIVGAGQAGLAMSRSLSDLDIEHVVLERGGVAERWRRDGWDSLRLLTPNWMTRLPGFQYAGDDPHGFMAVPELIAFLETYATASRAPIVRDAEVERVEASGSGFRVTSTRGCWLARSVVVATGHAHHARVPAIARRLSPAVVQLAASEYRNPNQLPPGGVLIVGASATGVQLANEIQRSGRQVTLAVGRHTRLPRRYRGKDILWWFDRLGIMSQDARAVHDIDVSRTQPSLQLVGRPDHTTLDLRVLRQHGVRLAGRVRGFDGFTAHFEGELLGTTAAADIKLAETLGRIDRFIVDHDVDAEPREPFAITWPLAAGAPTVVDLKADRIATTIWATGYRRSYPWLRLPVIDDNNEILHHRGITPVPGLFVLGLRFQRRRNSNFIDGVGDDARVLAAHLADALEHRRVA